jgi:hypothetical protein
MNYLAIYISGYVVSYLCIRVCYIVEKEEWTLRDRMLGVGISLFSWGVVLILIFYTIGKAIKKINFDFDKKVKW